MLEVSSLELRSSFDRALSGTPLARIVGTLCGRKCRFYRGGVVLNLRWITSLANWCLDLGGG